MDNKSALRLEPFHFSAMQGRALSLFHLEQYDKSIDAFAATLSIHPWMDGVGTALQVARKARQEDEEERQRRSKIGRFGVW
jgi:hypothetical protein